MEMFKLLSILIVILIHDTVGEQLEDQQLEPHNYIQNQVSLPRAKRMYAMCPPDFIKIGNECYYLSTKQESWLDAHFECKDRNSKLAEPLKFADQKIRKYLTNKDSNRGEKWIGGMYNWERLIWQWGYNGKAMTYQSFSNMGTKSNEQLKYHCTILNPTFNYKWSSKMCTEKHYFICQHHLTTVNEKDRVNIYNKWNETYPHQTANEVVIYVKGNIKRNPVAVTTLKSEVTTVKSIDDSFVLNSRNSDLHPVHNSHAVFHQQVNMKPKKRHSVLKLTGEVNLGIDKRERKRGNKQQSHLQKPDKPVEKIIGTTTRRSTTTSTVSSTTIPTTTTEYLSPTTTQKSSTTISNSARIERLKQRLAKLSPEDKNSFLQMKRERVETKKKYNQTVET